MAGLTRSGRPLRSSYGVEHIDAADSHPLDVVEGILREALHPYP